MRVLFLLFFLPVNAALFAQYGMPAVVSYRDCETISTERCADTICGIPVTAEKTVVRGTQRIQRLCNFGNPADNRYENVSVIAEISVVSDPAGILQQALYSEIRSQIRSSEAYAASNGFRTSVVSLCAVFQIGELVVASMPPVNSGEGNSGIWYVDGYLYKVKLIEDNGMGSIRVFLRENFLLSLNGAFLNPDKGDHGIERLRALVGEQ